MRDRWIQGGGSFSWRHEIDHTRQRGIKPEALPPEEDIKKLERRVKSEEKKLEQKSGRLPGK
jgi:hypothetical protein